MKLSEINIYPIKSLAGIRLESALVEDRGLQFDRRWMLVDEDRKFITQRVVPKMALVKMAVDGSGLTASVNGDSFQVTNDQTTGETDVVDIFGISVAGVEFYPKEVDDWFSLAIGSRCRLVLMPETTKRFVHPDAAVRKFQDTVSFADAYPFLLIGETSLADLNSRLDTPVPMNRFRPNFVVSGSEAFEEDTWKRIRIGSTEFHLVEPCARCVLTTVDQTTGEKEGKEPLKTLASYRTQNGNVLFGENLIAETAGGTVRAGDDVEVLEKN